MTHQQVTSIPACASTTLDCTKVFHVINFLAVLCWLSHQTVLHKQSQPLPTVRQTLQIEVQ